MMKKTILFGSFAILLMGLVACSSHYELASIERSRIVVDSRYDTQPDAMAVAFLSPYKQKVDSIMGPVVGWAAHDMAAFRPESELSNLLPDILMWAAKDYDEEPAFGIYNIGGIRAALSKGEVTFGDINDVAPFENKICFLTLTGEKVLELFSQIVQRGGEGISHGVEIVMTADRKMLSARLHGKEIDPKASYRITTIDYLAQGNDHLDAFKDHTNLNAPQEDINNTRFIIANYFKEMNRQGKAVEAKIEGRIRVEN